MRPSSKRVFEKPTLERFDVWEERFQVEGFEKFFETKNIDYSGEEVRTAQKLNWTAVSNSLPDGVGGLKIEDFCTHGTKAYVMNFEEYMVPLDVQRRMRPPKVMVEEGQWDALVEGLLRKKICKVVPMSEVHHIWTGTIVERTVCRRKGGVCSGIGDATFDNEFNSRKCSLPRVKRWHLHFTYPCKLRSDDYGARGHMFDFFRGCEMLFLFVRNPNLLAQVHGVQQGD